MPDEERFTVIRPNALVLTHEQREALADVVFAAGLARHWLARHAPNATVNEIMRPEEREDEDPPLLWVLDRAMAAYRASGANVVFPEEERADD